MGAILTLLVIILVFYFFGERILKWLLRKLFTMHYYRQHESSHRTSNPFRRRKPQNEVKGKMEPREMAQKYFSKENSEYIDFTEIDGEGKDG